MTPAYAGKPTEAELVPSGRSGVGHGEDERVVEGERILGRFTVGERIGRGGYGTVHRAWDERLCRHVAVKSVEGAGAGRVMREAQAAARLNHPGIVTLYELGNHNGVAYLVSELVRGPNLRDYARSGDLSDRDLAEIGTELCVALAHAHSHGVVHRDIKPDNVLIRRGAGKRMRSGGERAMLADFGIAAIADEPTMTATGQVIGTLAYMAPEQAAGERAGPEADVYSLALTLYELWTGANPIAGATPAATAKAIGIRPPSLAERRPELPPALGAAIDTALEADPAARPSLEELGSALEGLAGALHPDRPVPEPEDAVPMTPLPEAIPARPFAVLLAAGGLSLAGLLAGLPGLAIVASLLLAPAALLLWSPRDWAAPALAPLLGLLGLAPLFTVCAATHRRPLARAGLAGLGWTWTVVAAVVVGRSLGVTAPDGKEAEGWASSGPVALDAVLAPLLGADALATGLVWVGAAVLLGAVLEFAGPALLALLGLVWAAGLVAALGAIGGPATPSLLLAPGLIAAVLWLAWDRAGRPEIIRHLNVPAAPSLGFGRLFARPMPDPVPPGSPRPRHPAESPLADADTRARGAASRHVTAALYGAGSRGRLP